MSMGKSNLSISTRVQMFRAGILWQESAIKDLISDAMAANMMHYLPKELAKHGRELVASGKLVVPES